MAVTGDPTTADGTTTASSGDPATDGSMTASGSTMGDDSATASTTADGDNPYGPCGCPFGEVPVGADNMACVCMPLCDMDDPMCPRSPVPTADAICWSSIAGDLCGLACPAEGRDDACPAGMVCLDYIDNKQLPGCLSPNCPTCMWP
jgi:hypothetical protein